MLSFFNSFSFLMYTDSYNNGSLAPEVNVGGMLSLANIIRLIYADPWYFGKDNIENPAPADVYAFGLLLVEIFTLRLPFQDDNDELGVEWPEFFKDKFSQGGKTDMRQIEKIKEKAIAHSVINCVRDPIDRPSLKWVNKHLHAANPHNKGKFVCSHLLISAIYLALFRRCRRING